MKSGGREKDEPAKCVHIWKLLTKEESFRCEHCQEVKKRKVNELMWAKYFGGDNDDDDDDDET